MMDPEEHPILRAARHWRDRCLREEGSVLSEERLWTLPHLEQLERHYTHNPRLGKGSFLVKLEEQLSAADPGARKLAAEMLWIMYLQLHSGAMNGSTKRLQCRQVWEWSGDPFPEDAWVVQDEVLDAGVSNPGTAYHTHRWREFRFLIDTILAWKRLSLAERERIMGDGWTWVEWLEGRKYVKGRQLRHILAFLLFPEKFERMTTGRHKEKVVRVFRERFGENPDAVDYKDSVQLDREVLRIRKRLAKEREIDPIKVDFYSPELRGIWLSKPGNDGGSGENGKLSPAEAQAWFKKRFGEVNAWLVGTGPGGRDWNEFESRGLVSIDQDALGDLQEYESQDEIHRTLAEGEGRRDPTQDALDAWRFGEEMAEGDLVLAREGRGRLLGWGLVTGTYEYVPETGEHQHRRSVEWKAKGKWDLPDDAHVKPKPLTALRERLPWLKKAFEFMEGQPQPSGASSSGSDFAMDDALGVLFLERSEFRQILHALGRKRNLILQGPPGVGKTFTARFLAWVLMGAKDPERLEFVQFHQSYAYEDFVQGWRPNEKGGFALRDGIFHRFCRKARERPDVPHVFIIDEINRGNVSRIFGELLMLVEADKRGPNHAIPLTYSPGERFHIPSNLHLVGLMNTADRSLALVDYALRRRFAFVNLEPAFGREKFTAHLVEAGVPDALVARLDNRMRVLNQVIREDDQNLGAGFEIGHSYFVPGSDDEDLDEAWYGRIVETEVAPLLREYWFDRPDLADERIRALLR